MCKFADALIKLNSTEADVEVFSSVHDWFTDRLDSVPRKYLSQKNIDSLIRIVNAIPRETNLVHTDFHTQNVMIDKNENLLIIDMADVGYGNPLFDIGSTYMTMCRMPKTDPRSSKAVSGLSCENSLKVWDVVAKKYFRTDDMDLIRMYEKKCAFLSDVRMAVVLSFSIDLAEYKKYIISFIEKWKVIRHEKKYIEVLGTPFGHERQW